MALAKFTARYSLLLDLAEKSRYLIPKTEAEIYILDNAIKDAEKSGYDILILDSLSAEWAGTGELLNFHTQITLSNHSNSYSAWGQITPKRNVFIDAIISSNLHIITIIRSKIEYAQFLNEHSKTEIKKMGLGLVQRDGIDYESKTVFDLSMEHTEMFRRHRMLFSLLLRAEGLKSEY